MPVSYLQDEDEDQIPFFSSRPPEDDGPVDSDGRPRPFVMPPPRRFGDQSPSLPPAPPLKSAPPTTVTPEMQRILADGSPSAAPGNPPVTEKATQAREALAAAKANAPVMPAPKWWQRVGAAAVGGLAGYVNASGKRMTPIDPTAAEQAIIGVPAFQRQVAAHQQEVNAAQAQADVAQANEQAWWKNRQLNNQEELQKAEAERARQQGDYYGGRDAASVERAKTAANEKLEQQLIKPWGDDVRIQHETDPVPPGMETTRSIVTPSMVYVHPPAYVPLPEDLAPYATGRKAGDTIPWSEFRRAQAAAQKDTLQQNKPDKPRNFINVAPGHSVYDPDARKTVYTAPGKPEGNPKPPAASQMRGIEAKKNDRLNTAEAAARKRISQGDDKDTVMGELEADKQRIQNEYEGEIHAATGNYPGHFEYPTKPAAPASSAPTAAPAPAAVKSPVTASGGGRGGSAAGGVSEKALRAAAIAAGKDPEAAVALARQRKLTLIP